MTTTTIDPITALTEFYGQSLEQLNKAEKLHLVCEIAELVSRDNPLRTYQKVLFASATVEELNNEQRIDLLVAIANQLKSQTYAQ